MPPRDPERVDGILWPQVAVVASNVAGKPLQRLAGALVPGDKESSAFHQSRLVVKQLLWAVLKGALACLGLTRVDLDACLRPNPDICQNLGRRGRRGLHVRRMERRAATPGRRVSIGPDDGRWHQRPLDGKRA